jgi:hypothetical protein
MTSLEPLCESSSSKLVGLVKLLNGLKYKNASVLKYKPIDVGSRSNTVFRCNCMFPLLAFFKTECLLVEQNPAIVSEFVCEFEVFGCLHLNGEFISHYSLIHNKKGLKVPTLSVVFGIPNSGFNIEGVKRKPEVKTLLKTHSVFRGGLRILRCAWPCTYYNGNRTSQRPVGFDCD